ncbi:hypothetical protein HPB52_016647 [Rhipicephalus sanguineus]|uniref:Uncharacterized protein n=1 Tax=Rhipicephalus sanguineus TaxID=34632 RepID=A0A9D4SSU9_RHISA|nr:hypothetical protein HPB52_016647 [Rhipicephalus sanguineus]
MAEHYIDIHATVPQRHALTKCTPMSLQKLQCGDRGRNSGAELWVVQKAHDDELPSADVAFDDLRAGGVLIPAEITLEGFADADKDLELCAELTDDEIIHQVTEDSDADTENEEPAPTQPTNTELMRALMTLSLVYSGNMTLTEIEADIIAGKWTVQKKISDFFAPKC